MSSKLVLQDATIDGFRQFVSKAGKPCFMAEVSFFGGNTSLFLDAAVYAGAIQKFPKGSEVDIVGHAKLQNGKFEFGEVVEFYPAGSVVVDTDAKPATVKAPQAQQRAA